MSSPLFLLTSGTRTFTIQVLKSPTNIIMAILIILSIHGKTTGKLVEFEVLTAVRMKMAVFWVVAPCSLVEVYQHFRGTCCLHHQGITLKCPLTCWQTSTTLHGDPGDRKILLQKHSFSVPPLMHRFL
jgi:hypothetical protein